MDDGWSEREKDEMTVRDEGSGNVCQSLVVTQDGETVKNGMETEKKRTGPIIPFLPERLFLSQNFARGQIGEDDVALDTGG